VAYWSFYVEASKAEPLLDPATLKIADKRALWAGIKTVNPSLAKMLAEDDTLKLFIKAFDAQIVFTKKEAKQYINQKNSK